MWGKKHPSVQKLTEELRLYRFAMDTAADFILWLNSDGEITYANASICQRLGYSSEELLGAPVSQIDPSWNPIIWESRWAELTRSGVLRLELAVKSRAGEVTPVDLSANFFRSDGSDFCCAILKDITERRSQERRFQEVLRQSIQYRFALDQAAIVSITQTDGNLVHVNEKLCTLLGYSRDELMANQNPELLPALLSYEAWERASDGRVWRGEVSLRTRAGETRWLDLMVVPFMDEWGSAQQFMSIGYDISDKRRQETLLREQEAKLVHASKMSTLGEMAGGIAHEINNPLAIIQGHATILFELAQTGELNSSLVTQSSEKIALTVERIARIIQGLRTFARDGTGDPFVPTPLHEIVRDTLELCQARFKSADVRLRVDAIPAELQLECRATQISQVLLNLMNNALDAVRGTKNAWVELRVLAFPDHVELRLSDSGPGIFPEIAEKIMQPFFTTKAVGKGSGLGLSISSGIVRSHQGSLCIDAEARNTCFVLILPRKQRVAQAA